MHVIAHGAHTLCTVRCAVVWVTGLLVLGVVRECDQCPLSTTGLPVSLTLLVVLRMEYSVPHTVWSTPYHKSAPESRRSVARKKGGTLASGHPRAVGT
jgi:hypothetical protein